MKIISLLRLEEQFRVGIYDDEIVGDEVPVVLGLDPPPRETWPDPRRKRKIWFNCDDVWINPSGMENIFFLLFIQCGTLDEKGVSH